MKRTNFKLKWLVPVLACLTATAGQGAALLTNGGFESGFAGWTRVDQAGSEGTFTLQTGSAPEGNTAAVIMDAQGPGSHILYQDFLVPLDIPTAMLSFSLSINNAAPDFYVADHLDFATPDLNQQVRVDILTTSADPFSSDVLLNLFQTQPGDPLVSSYTTRMTNLTAFLQAHQGETLRLRFAEVDNVLNLNIGIDDVDISVDSVNPIPEPSTWFTTIGALLAAVLIRRSTSALTRQ